MRYIIPYMTLATQPATALEAPSDIENVYSDLEKRGKPIELSEFLDAYQQKYNIGISPGIEVIQYLQLKPAGKNRFEVVGYNAISRDDIDVIRESCELMGIINKDGVFDNPFYKLSRN